MKSWDWEDVVLKTMLIAIVALLAVAAAAPAMKHPPVVVVHYPAYCFPGGPWSIPGETMVHLCRTDMIVEI